MALKYPRLDVKVIAGALVSFPIDLNKTLLQGNDFVQDAYIQSLKPGVVVKMAPEGYIKPAGADAGDVPLGVLVNSADGYANQNVNAQATGLLTALVGSGNQFVTDNVKDNNIAVGDKLYVGTDGVLTKTAGTLTTAVAVALSANSAADKSVLCQQLV